MLNLYKRTKTKPKLNLNLKEHSSLRTAHMCVHNCCTQHSTEISPDEGFRREAETSINSMSFWLY